MKYFLFFFFLLTQCFADSYFYLGCASPNKQIIKLNTTTYETSTFLGDYLTANNLTPLSIAIDNSGSFAYIGCSGGGRIF